MTDIVLESIRVLVLGVILVCLWLAGRNGSARALDGWRHILAGFAFIFFGALLDITDNFPALNRFLVIGDTPYQAFLEKAAGSLVGLILIATGFWKWLRPISAIASMKKEKTELLAANEALELEIVERRRAEKALRSNKELLQNILDAIQDGITVLDGDLNILRENQTSEQWNSPFPSLAGRKCHEAYHGRTTPCDDCPSLRALREGTGQMKTAYMTGAEGEERWFDLFAYPISDASGSPAGVVEIARDISDRVLSEQALKKAREEAEKARRAAEVANRAKSEFLASMSHELRTPLNAILGYAQILQQDQEMGEKQRDGLDTIQQSGEHLLTLLNDILDLSKIEAGRMELEPGEFRLETFLKNIVDIFQVKAGQKRIRFSYDAPVSLPEAVKGDEVRLRQVLFNLLGNAVKFTARGVVTFRIGERGGASGAHEPPHVQPARARNEYAPIPLFFEIEDTGPGIDEDDLETIFSPFKQVGSRLGKSQGSGLGLAISKRLVDMMGGALTVESVLGEGSIFRIDIDLPPVYSMTEVAEPKNSPIIGYGGPRRKVLVVDDASENRELLSFLLKPLGFDVSEAVNGREGVEKAGETSPDLIFMDRYMPEMDGLEATRRIRAFSPPLDVIIIAISASAFGEDRRKSLEAGCDDFVTKPFNINDVREKLRRYLSLEWIHEEKEPRADETREPTPSIQPPPADDLEMLISFAKVGDIRAIRGCAERIEGTHPEFKPFAAELNRLAKSFQIDRVRGLLNSFVKTK